MVKKRRWIDPTTHPTPTTSAKWTNVRDPRAAVRFSLDERVAWDEGDRIVLATVLGYTDDECAIRVRLESGATAVWPTVSARLRRVQTPDYHSHPGMATVVEDEGHVATLPIAPVTDEEVREFEREQFSDRENERTVQDSPSKRR